MRTGWQDRVTWIVVVIGLSAAPSWAEAPANIADDAGSISRAAPLASERITDAAPPPPSPQVPAAALPPRAARELAGSPALPPPTRNRFAQRAAGAVGATGKTPTWIAGRLAMVLGLFLGLIAVQKLLLPRPRVSLPVGMIHVCGKVPLDAKQSLHLVRIGQRLLVLLESPQGMQRIAEITDPQEVQRLLDPHAQAPPGLGSLNVGQVLSKFRHQDSSLA